MIQNPNVKVRNFIVKDGIVFNGTIESEQDFTYFDNLQFFRIRLEVTEGNTGAYFSVRDNSTPSFSNGALLKVYDEDTGQQCSETIQLAYAKTYNLIVDARLASIMKIYLYGSGATCKLSVTKDFLPSVNIDGIKFTNLIVSGASGSKNIVSPSFVRHSKYALVKCTMSSAVDNVIIFYDNTDQAYISDNKQICKVFGVGGNTRASVNVTKAGLNTNYTGTRHFYVDLTNVVSNFNIYINSAITNKISELSIAYTDDLEFAKKFAGIRDNDKPVDIVRGGVVKFQNFPLAYFEGFSNKRWYVVYVDFIRGTMTGSSEMSLPCRDESGAYKMPRTYNSDLSKYGNSSYNFFSLDGRIGKSGFYFFDLSSVPNLSHVNFVIGYSFTGDVDVNITHYGQYSDISEFVKNTNNQIYLGTTCKLVNSGKSMGYALGKYYADTLSQTSVIVGTEEDTITINLSDFGWTLVTDPQYSYRDSLKIMQPCYTNTNTYGNRYNLLMYVTESGVSKWMVCSITNMADALTKSNWKEVKFWEKEGTNRKIPVSNSSSADAKHRYDTTLPEDMYTANEVTGDGKHIAYQGTPNLHSLQWFHCATKKVSYIGTYSNSTDRLCVWATSDGGENFVAIYDFTPLSPAGADINTSAFSAYSSGLTASKITRNIPSEAVKEPEHPYTIVELPAISSITKGSSTNIVFSSAHGLSNNDVIAFTGSSTSEWNQLRTSTLTSDTIGDNVYAVSVIDSTTVTIKYFKGSYDSNLVARHIHSISETKSGVIVATGERYPNSWTMMVLQNMKDGTDEVDVMTEVLPVYRLNSSEDGMQRAAGIVMTENTQDPMMLWNSDDSTLAPFNYTIEGRTISIPAGSSGIWKGKLSDIDDRTKWECVQPIPEAAIWMYRQGDIIVAYYMLGGLAISFDNGNTFEYCPTYQRSAFLVGIFNGKIVLDWGCYLEKVI